MENLGSELQGIDATRLQNRPQHTRATRLADVEAPRDRAGRDPTMGRRSVSQGHRVANGSERVDVALEHSRNRGRVWLSAGESGKGREVPNQGRQAEAHDDRGRGLQQVAESARGALSNDGQSHRRDRASYRGIAGASMDSARSRGRYVGGSRISLRGDVPAAEDAEGDTNDSVGPESGAGAQGPPETLHSHSR